ncbi:MAG: hypothetical protein QOA16_02530, partial [Nitrososphaeraceae archaeon]|nr:hypothetical protein [Nitrososphaeraceae archaeon]
IIRNYMNENLVTHDSIEDLLKSIPQKNRDVIRKLVEDLFISEAFMEPIKEYENANKNYSRNFFDVTVSRRGDELVYPDLHENSISVPLLKVLQWIKRDLSLTDSYDEFKRKWDLENKKRIINYDELKKQKDPDVERSYRLLQERKTKLKKMFSQDEVDAIPAPTEEL